MLRMRLGNRGGGFQRALAVDVETECFECDWGMGGGGFQRALAVDVETKWWMRLFSLQLPVERRRNQSVRRWRHGIAGDRPPVRIEQPRGAVVDVADAPHRVLLQFELHVRRFQRQVQLPSGLERLPTGSLR